MYLAVDVCYRDDQSGQAAGVLFVNPTDAHATRTISCLIPHVSDYVPGSFYLRELPCILAVLEEVSEPLTTILVDGFVDLDGRPGLGRHLYDHLNARVPVIGVAKTAYAGAVAQEVLRPGSIKPLYVTSAGIDGHAAADLVKGMHGAHRIPTLLTLVDHVSRGLRSH